MVLGDRAPRRGTGHPIGRHSRVTVPLLPSTRTMSPVLSSDVPLPVPVTAGTPGVQLISGFSPALLKVVTTGKRMVTPWETFLDAVLDARYDLVRELVEAAGEIGPAE